MRLVTMKKNTAFTLMELVIVVVLIGIMAAFAIPNYAKSVLKTHERDAIMQLTTLYAANLIYNAQAGEYLQGGTIDLAAINSGLGINIIANGMTYSYTSGGQNAYSATAAWDEAGTENDFGIRVNEKPIDTTASPPDRNPCCLSGPCPSLGSCT